MPQNTQEETSEYTAISDDIGSPAQQKIPFAPKDAKIDLKINTFDERSNSMKTYEEQEKQEGRNSRTDNDLIASKTVGTYGMLSSCT